MKARYVVGVLAVVLLAFGFVALIRYSLSPDQLRRSCDRGRTAMDIGQCAELAELYVAGRGVPKDDAMAFSLFTKACNGDNAWGCGELGFYYANGRTVPVDYARALTLFTKSCDAKSMYGCNGLGELYRDGHGVPKDEARALHLFQTVCEESESHVGRSVKTTGHEYGCDNFHELEARSK
jgi:TPR repeat protein